MTLAVLVPLAALLAVDVYLHGKYANSAGFNVWGYRGARAGRKQPYEYRIVMLGGSSVYGYGVSADQAIPAQLERRLRAHTTRPVRVVNLAYNNEGAYSFLPTLRYYAYLGYDLAILYEGYNDVMSTPEHPNVSVFRHDSPLFRLTGYLPIFPIVFKEKASAMLYGGDISSLYRDTNKTVFRPGLAARVGAGALNATAEAGTALERGLGRVSVESEHAIAGTGRTGCHRNWRHYCESVLAAIDYALDRQTDVLVATQPYERLDDYGYRRHLDQQTELAGMLRRLFHDDPRVAYANFGDTLDLRDTRLAFDGMHLTASGSAIIAEAFVPEVMRSMDAPPARTASR